MQHSTKFIKHTHLAHVWFIYRLHTKPGLALAGFNKTTYKKEARILATLLHKKLPQNHLECAFENYELACFEQLPKAQSPEPSERGVSLQGCLQVPHDPWGRLLSVTQSGAYIKLYHQAGYLKATATITWIAFNATCCLEYVEYLFGISRQIGMLICKRFRISLRSQCQLSFRAQEMFLLNSQAK